MTTKTGIDWTKKDMYDGIGRPDLKPKNKCTDCDSEYKEIANCSCVICKLKGYELDNNLEDPNNNIDED
jgi:hypothetical protein